MPVLPPIVEQPASWNENPVFFWNAVALDLNRLTHSVRGPQSGPPISARALGILHVAIYDAVAQTFQANGTLPAGVVGATPFLPTLAGVPAGPNNQVSLAIAGAAITVLQSLHGRQPKGSTNVPQAAFDALEALIARAVGETTTPQMRKEASFLFGRAVGEAALLALRIRPNEPGASQLGYQPKVGQYYFRDEPTNPVKLEPGCPDGPADQVARRIYHAPYYGVTARPFAITQRHQIADPPTQASAGSLAGTYIAALRDVYHLGGATGAGTTTRTPDQTVVGYFWAYDGANLIGTPTRHYNQICRRIAWARRPNPAGAADALDNVYDAARLFGLVNVALADAGMEAWRHKYYYEFWRPLSGVREHEPQRANPSVGTVGPTDQAPPTTGGAATIDADADPFWRTLGAPSTNTNDISFKPPFPAYPSGHATFGAAAFQVMRRYYHDRDGLTFDLNPFDCDASGPTDLTAYADGIAFASVSDELDGVSRDLQNPYDPARPITDQPGVVRTRIVRAFASLWDAILSNADSRVYIGVHWRFDSYGFKVNANTGALELDPALCGPRTGPDATKSDQPFGGVPLGMAIADDVFDHFYKSSLPAIAPILDTRELVETADQAVQEAVRRSQQNVPASNRVPVKIESTNIR